jgi:hypothetical protein
MLTRNFYNCLGRTLRYAALPVNIVDKTGTAQNGVNYSTSGNQLIWSLTTDTTNPIADPLNVRYDQPITFGSGTTPPTIDDYNVESFIENLYPNNNSITVSPTGGINVNTTIRNGNATEVTINEVCLYSSTSRNNSGILFLTFREVLPTPVVLQPNELYTFSVNIQPNSQG